MMMRRVVFGSALLAVASVAACSTDNSGLVVGAGTAGSGSGGDNGNAGTGGGAGEQAGNNGQTGGAPVGGTGGASPMGGTSATGGSKAGGTGGTPVGGSGGTPNAGGSPNTGGTPSLACPGTAPGCVIDFAGTVGSDSGSPGTDGIGKAATLPGLASIATSGDFLYVTTNFRVRRINVNTGEVSTVAGNGQPGYVNGTAAQSRFAFVDGIATDGRTVWVADTGNDVIRTINLQSGMVGTLAGVQGNPGDNDGPGQSARFDGLRGMTYDGVRFLYVTDTANQSIRRIDTQTRDVRTIAGHNGPGNRDGDNNDAEFNTPRKVYAISQNRLLVGDTENHRVRSVTVGDGGQTSTVAGSFQGFRDAIGVMARFNRLRGITSDPVSVIVADSDNYVLREISLEDGNVRTIAGSPGLQGHAEGIGMAARFDKPMDLVFHPGSGDLFIIEGTVVRRMYYK